MNQYEVFIDLRAFAPDSVCVELKRNKWPLCSVTVFYIYAFVILSAV